MRLGYLMHVAGFDWVVLKKGQQDDVTRVYGSVQAEVFCVSPSHIIYQNGTASGFEMCFTNGSQHLVSGVATKTRLESENKEV